MGMKIVVGDDVVVISGKDKGRMGKVIKVLRKNTLVRVFLLQ